MKLLFWNVDTQKDFMNENGALYVKGAEEIKPILKEITEYASINKIKVVSTADCHTDKSTEISDKPDFKTTFPPHCMLLGGEGIEFIEETYPKTFKDNYTMVCYSDKEMHHSFDRARNVIIYKDAFDVFAGNHMTEKVIERISPDTVVVYGVATEVCVHFAVLGLLRKGLKVYVVSNAVKELSEYGLDEVYREWLDKGVKVRDWEYIKNECIKN